MDVNYSTVFWKNVMKCVLKKDCLQPLDKMKNLRRHKQVGSKRPLTNKVAAIPQSDGTRQAALQAQAAR